MTYQLDSKNGEVVDGYGSLGRWIQLLSIALVCVALPIGIYYILERKAGDPFDPGSEGYPAVLFIMFGGPVLLFGYCFYFIRKGFRHLYIDETERSMHLTWQGLWGEWNETIRFDAIRGFSVKRIVISRYRYGWELRADQPRGHYLRLARFYDEEVALGALKSVINIYNNARSGDQAK